MPKLEESLEKFALENKMVEHRLAAQQRHLLHLAVGHAQEAGGGVQDMGDDGARQPFDGQQVLQFTVERELPERAGEAAAFLATAQAAAWRGKILDLRPLD